MEINTQNKKSLKTIKTSILPVVVRIYRHYACFRFNEILIVLQLFNYFFLIASRILIISAKARNKVPLIKAMDQ